MSKTWLTRASGRNNDYLCDIMQMLHEAPYGVANAICVVCLADFQLLFSMPHAICCMGCPIPYGEFVFIEMWCFALFFFS